MVSRLQKKRTVVTIDFSTSHAATVFGNHFVFGNQFHTITDQFKCLAVIAELLLPNKESTSSAYMSYDVEFKGNVSWKFFREFDHVASLREDGYPFEAHLAH